MEQQIMDFLEEKVFAPALAAKGVPQYVRQGIENTRFRMGLPSAWAST
jgi:hypothetical protein